MAGLYSAGGAPLAYFAYRQPISINTIRTSLLAVFGVSTAIRVAMIGASGQVNISILQMSAVTFPLVIVVTLVTNRFVQMVPDHLVRRSVFLTLIAAGAFLVIGSLQPDFGRWALECTTLSVCSLHLQLVPGLSKLVSTLMGLLTSR